MRVSVLVSDSSVRLVISGPRHATGLRVHRAAGWVQNIPDSGSDAEASWHGPGPTWWPGAQLHVEVLSLGVSVRVPDFHKSC